MSCRAWMVGGVGAAVLFGASAAQAQTAGFAIDRFNPAEAGSEWFVLDSLDMRGRTRPALSLMGEEAHRPLAIYEAGGSVRSSVVENQFFLHIAGSVVLFERVRLGLDLPVAAYQNGAQGTVGAATYEAPSSHAALGDIRIGADVRLLGEAGQPLSLAAGLQIFIPSGSRDQYTGDGNVRLFPRVMAAGELGPFAYAGQVGFQYRVLSEDFGQGAIGSEVLFGLGAGVHVLEKKLLIGPELYGGTVVTKSSVAFSKVGSPLELLFGAHYRLPAGMRIGAGGGFGLTRGYGTPQMRFVASLGWEPEAAPTVLAGEPDRDGDGIPDRVDACPDVPGIKSNDPKQNGCPDRDGDGIADNVDACPDVPGVRSDDPKKNGCPGDRDGDGIADNVDACPDVPGEPSENPRFNGCPPDIDGDGIANIYDACPNEPGPKNADPAKNGCPAAAVRGGDIVPIISQVKFKTNSAELMPGPESLEALDGVLKVLQEHSEIRLVHVEGHTDSVGPADYNDALSVRRAQTVIKWFLSRGVAKERLTGQGFGFKRPIAPNDTPSGRQINRRVEFHIEEQGPRVPQAPEVRP